MTLMPGDFLWCRRLVQYILACYEEKIKKSTAMLAAPATLISIEDVFRYASQK